MNLKTFEIMRRGVSPSDAWRAALRAGQGVERTTFMNVLNAISMGISSLSTLEASIADELAQLSMSIDETVIGKSGDGWAFFGRVAICSSARIAVVLRDEKWVVEKYGTPSCETSDRRWKSAEAIARARNAMDARYRRALSSDVYNEMRSKR